MNRVMQRQYLFRPVTVLLVSIVAAAIFALFVTLVFDGELRLYLLYYFTPIGIPFVAFLFDRAEHYAQASLVAWTVDLIVLILALARVLFPVPLVSGHALFLFYCLLTVQSKVARITAVLVLLQVAYLKMFVTHDIALFGGLVVGWLAAVLYRQLPPRQQEYQDRTWRFMMSRSLLMVMSLALLAVGLFVMFRSVPWGMEAANAYLQSQGGGMDTNQFVIVVQESIRAYRWIGSVVAVIGGFGFIRTIELR